MKYIWRLIIIAAIFIAANLVLWAPKASLIDHTEKPTGRYAQRKKFEQNLLKYKPQIALLGNSMLTEGVHPRLFETYVEKRTTRLSRGGSASAWWYLVLKNVIAESENKPEVVVIFFRDNYLTIPGHRVDGEFKLTINDMANEDEPLLDRLAYLNGMNRPTFLLSKYLPLFRQKDKIREDIESFIKNGCVSKLLGSNIESIDDAMLDVFNKKKMNRQLMTARQQAVELKTSKDKINFQAALKNSFLPHMIDIAERKDIHLVFVRVKKRRDIKPDAQPQLIKNYIENLRAYLTSRDIELFDFSNDRNLKLEHYANGDHMNRTKGIPLFTKITAKALMPIIKEHCK